MNEVEELIETIQGMILDLTSQQLERQRKTVTPIETFLNLPREEAWSKRIVLLIKAQDALSSLLADDGGAYHDAMDEVERLTLAATHEDVLRLIAERDAARAEVAAIAESHREWERKANTYRAELDRLVLVQDGWDAMRNATVAERDDARAELSALRERITALCDNEEGLA